MASVLLLSILGLAAYKGVLAHPGHNVAGEAIERADFMKRNPRSVQACSVELTRRGHMAQALTRREELANKVRMKRALTGTKPMIHRRDFATYDFSHASTKDVGMGSDETLLFADNSSCLLQPEVTQGPYYIDGELIRQDVSEDQEGVPLFVDIQIIDTSTCEPIQALFIDFWHCNSTGVYSGVSATGNGNGNDTSNLNNTYNRGIQQTDFNGVAQFQTTFPGHYIGRTTHIHIMTHNSDNTVVRTNSTILGNNATAHASHVGQLFFDQDLITLVETTEPYASNTQELTTNAVDSILSEEAATSDPFVEYVLLGDDVSDGILAWISIGIDPAVDNEITAAATIHEDGGVANPYPWYLGQGGASVGLPPASSETSAV